MEADVLNALKSRVAYLPGGRDHDSNLLIIFQLPSELQPWTRRYIEISTRYLLSSLRYVEQHSTDFWFHFGFDFSKQTLNNGLIAIVDAQKCSWRQARDQIKLITQLLDEHLINLYVVRTEAFSMQNCAKTNKKGEVRDWTKGSWELWNWKRVALNNRINSIMLLQLNILAANFSVSLCKKFVCSGIVKVLVFRDNLWLYLRVHRRDNIILQLFFNEYLEKVF